MSNSKANTLSKRSDNEKTMIGFFKLFSASDEQMDYRVFVEFNIVFHGLSLPVVWICYISVSLVPFTCHTRRLNGVFLGKTS